MAASTVPAAGRPYLNLSEKIQAFYARRGMWKDGKPAGLLETWLGERCEWPAPAGVVTYWVSLEGVRAMAADALAAPAVAWQHPAERGQFLRRMRESLQRSGETWETCLTAAPSLGTTDAAPIPTGRYAWWRKPGSSIAACTAPTHAAVPYRPLVVPTEARQRAAFEEHVMRTLREFVEFTQGTEYDPSLICAGAADAEP